MKTSYRRLLFVSLFLTVLLIAVGTGAAACGGDDDELTLEEYFQQSEALSADAGEELVGVILDEAAMAVLASTDAGYDAGYMDSMRRLVKGFAAQWTGFTDDLSDLDPPPEAEAAHGELVDALREASTVLEDSADQLEGAQSASEVGQLIDNLAEALGEPGARANDACFALLDIADANDIVAALTCQYEG